MSIQWIKANSTLFSKIIIANSIVKNGASCRRRHIRKREVKLFTGNGIVIGVFKRMGEMVAGKNRETCELPADTLFIGRPGKNERAVLRDGDGAVLALDKEQLRRRSASSDRYHHRERALVVCA